MKINRFIALAALALLVVGAMGTISYRTLAASNTAVSTQSQSCDQQDDDSHEVAEAADTDNVDLQCGEQVEDGQPDGAEDAEVAGTESNEANEAATLQSKAAVFAADAESAALAANPGTSVVKTELDDENGTVVYSVELSNGADVKVDAANGTILTTDSGADNEG